MYGVDLLDHTTGLIRRCDYVGQTRQQLRTRGNQHRDCQPWEDLIVGDFYILEQGMWTDAELDAAEMRLIAKRRPRMNWVGNENNPEQVPKWVQRDQRWERDDRAGRPRWQPLDSRQPVPMTRPRLLTRVVSRLGPGRRSNRRRPWHIITIAWMVAWAMMSSMLWEGLKDAPIGTEGGRAAASAFLPVAALAWGVWKGPAVWKRLCRKVRRWPR